MDKIKNKNSLKYVLLGALVFLTSIMLAACGCQKKIKPQSMLGATEVNTLFVNKSNDLTLYVMPEKAKVSEIVINNPSDVVSVEQTFNEKNKFIFKITGLKIGECWVTFSVKGTNIKKTVYCEVLDDPTPLVAPTNLTCIEVEDESGSKHIDVQWDAVENATGYMLNVNGTEFTTTLSKFSLTGDAAKTIGENYVNELKVKSLGDDRYFIDSTYGGYEEEPYKFVKLAKPENLSYDAISYKVNWKGSQFTSKYVVLYKNAYMSDPVEINTINNEFSIKDIDVDIMEIQVKAVSDGTLKGVDVIDSEYSIKSTLTKLKAPKSLKVQNREVGGLIEEFPILSWDKVNGAIKYQVFITNKNNMKKQNFFVENNFCEIKNYETGVQLKAGEYQVNIVSCGPGGLIINSNQSASYKFSILGTVRVDYSEITNNILKVDKVQDAVKYEFIFEDVKKNKIVKVTPMNYLDLSKLTDLSLGVNTIYVKACYSTWGDVANGSRVKINRQFKVVPNPEVLKVDNYGVAYFENKELLDVPTDLYYNVVVEHIVRTPEGKIEYVKVDDQLISKASNKATLSGFSQGENILGNRVTVSSVTDKSTYIALDNATSFKFYKAVSPNISTFTLEKIGNKQTSIYNISWASSNNIEGYSDKYRVSLNGVLETDYYTNATFLIKDSGRCEDVNELKVYCEGNNYNVVNSDVNSVVPVFNFTKLNKISNFTTENGILTWDAVADANYAVFITSLENVTTVYEVSENRLNLNDIDFSTQKSCYIKAYKNGFLESDKSDSINLIRLVEPETVIEKKVSLSDEEEFSLVIRNWDENSVYSLEITTPSGETILKELTKTEIERVNETDGKYAIQEVLEVGKYSFNVKLRAGKYNNSELYKLDSLFSATLQIEKVDTAKGVVLLTDINYQAFLQWELVGNATLYKLYFTNPNGKTFKVVVEGLKNGSDSSLGTGIIKYNIPDNSEFAIPGEWSVQIVACAEDDNSLIAKSEKSEKCIFSKVKESSSLGIENGVIKLNVPFDSAEPTLNDSYFVDVYYVDSANKENPIKIDSKSIMSDYENKISITIPSLNSGEVKFVTVKIRHKNLIESEFSNVIKVVKLSTVQGFDINTIGTEKFNWQVVQNASKYNIFVNNPLENVDAEGIDVFTNSWDINRSLLEASKTYDIRVMAIGNTVSASENSYENIGYLNSDKTQERLLTKLSPVDVSTVKIASADGNNLNNRIMWDLNVANVEFNYSVKVSYGVQSAQGSQRFNEIFNKDQEMSLSLKGKTFGNYAISFVCKGDGYNLLDSDLVNASSGLKKLQAPDSIRVANGRIECENNCIQTETARYVVYIGDKIIVDDVADLNDPQVLEKINTYNIQEFKVRVKDNLCIASEYSNLVNISKLEKVTNFRVEENKLKWNNSNVQGSNGYKIDITLNGDTSKVYTFSLPKEALEFDIRNELIKLTKEDLELKIDTYNVKMQIIGNTTLVPPIGGGSSVNPANYVGYISSDFTDEINGSLLATVQNIEVNETKGSFVVWDEIPNAISYKVKIINSDTNLENETKILDKNTYNFAGYTEGNWKIKVTAIGNNAENLDGAESVNDLKFTNKNFMSGAPYVEGGRLMWLVKIDDIKDSFEEEFATDEQKITKINDVILNPSLNDKTALGLQHIINYDVVINNYSTQNFKPDYVEKYVDKEVTYVRFVSIFRYQQGEYTIQLRTTYNNNVSTKIIINGKYSESCSFEKLPPPVLPVNENTTAVINNKIVWQAVNVNGVEHANIEYLIMISDPSDPKFRLYQKLDNSNIIYDSDIHQCSYSLYNIFRRFSKSNEQNFIMQTNTNYDIKLITYSVKSVEKNYVLSAYYTVAPIMFLGDTNMYVENGIVKWDLNEQAVGYKITFKYVDSANNFTRDVLLDNINEYDMTTNDFLIDGNYEIFINVQGDGVRTISPEYSEGDNADLRLHKLKATQNVFVKKGKFAFNLVPNTINYRLTIISEENGEIIEHESIDKVFTDNTEHIGIFELPENYLGGNIEYKLKVVALGTKDKSSMGSLLHNSNASESAKYKRVEMPTNLSAKEGIIGWDNIPNAEYEIKINNVSEGILQEPSYNNMMGKQSGMYAVEVRTMPLDSDDTILCSQYTEKVKFKLIDAPILNIERGLITWAGQDVAHMPVGLINVDIQGLEEIKNIVDNKRIVDGTIKYLDMQSIMVVDPESGQQVKNRPFGKYKIDITFSGSNEKQYDEETGDYYYYLGAKTTSITVNKLKPISVEEGGEKIESSGEGLETNEFKNFAYWNKPIGESHEYRGYKVKIEIVKNSNVVATEIYDTKDDNPAGLFTDDGNMVSISYNKILEITNAEEFKISVAEYNDNENKNILSDYSKEIIFVKMAPPTSIKFAPKIGTIYWENINSDLEPVVIAGFKPLGGKTVEQKEVILSAGTSMFSFRDIGEYEYVKIGYRRNQKTYSTFKTFRNANRGYKIELFESGNGSKNNPYILSESKHLNNLITVMNKSKYEDYNIPVLVESDIYFTNCSFKLKNDIVLATGNLSNWTIINYTSNTFDFDGDGFAIRNILYKNKSISYNIGFIALNNGVIKNLTLSYIINIENFDGKFAGIANTNNGVITNCLVENADGNVANFGDVSKESEIAGLVNINNRLKESSIGVIKESQNKLNMQYSTDTATGSVGIAGIAHTNYGKILNCANMGNLTGNLVGGVVVSNSGLISGCYADSILTISDRLPLVVALGGGIAAINATQTNVGDGEIEFSYSYCQFILNCSVAQLEGKIGSAVGALVGNCLTDLTRIHNSFAIIKSYSNNGEKPAIDTYFGLLFGNVERGASNLENYKALYAVQLSGNTNKLIAKGIDKIEGSDTDDSKRVIVGETLFKSYEPGNPNIYVKALNTLNGKNEGRFVHEAEGLPILNWSINWAPKNAKIN